ncbi:uncharacterized protein DUF4232 [Kitasatospora cineracea]|uniref:Uncharacterized protein DUF4232 n=1 Tax=Kitasatospora cineracea TaxID=88074 RepID=A0A3N4RZ45_9ACTN|nr:uncharacterized protein DUF4232 [Kitasatospora cineracea]
MRAVRVGAGVVVAVAAVGAVAGCGSVVASGGTAAAASAEAGPCGAAPSARPAGWTRDAVRILAVSADCLEYEVTNEGTEPADLTVLFGWSGSGTLLPSDPTGTQTAVAPGASVRGRVPLTGHPVVPVLPVGAVPDSWPSSASPRPSRASGPAPDVKVLKVRSVPTAEAPSTGGACPASGVRVYADRGDAAMGLRVVGLHLENCGTRDVVLDGYPRTELLDEAHAPVAGVQVLKGGSAISTGTGADAPPRRFTVAPGGKASAGLVWRNTTDLSGAPVNAPYVRVRATADAAPVMVTPELDLGTTGRIGVGAWAPEQS